MSDQAPTDQAPSPAPSSPLRGFAGGVGRVVMDLGRTGYELYSVLLRTLYYCVRGRREPGAVVYYIYEMGNRSLFFLSVVMGFIGMIMIYQAAEQTLRVLPDLSLIGATYLELLVRDLAASLGAGTTVVTTTTVGFSVMETTTTAGADPGVGGSAPVGGFDWAAAAATASFGGGPAASSYTFYRPGSPYLGVGEGAMGPAPAAIANAVYDAVGVRLRTIPFTPERVKAALKRISRSDCAKNWVGKRWPI